ncbi:MAG: S-layer homology domain-containing protein [Clostridiales bacterium]|jgi:hypothetical protein|nr:S-layer homology domain-containing protein [Clostridiales bacterium]
MFYKKISSLFLSLSLILSLTITTYSASNAPSTDTSHWSSPAINFCTQNNLLLGDSDNYINPNLPLTRAQACALLSRINHLPGYKGAQIFTDVPIDSWFYSYVGAGYLNGYLQGYPNNSFAPDSPITRQDFLVILNRANSLSQATSLPNSNNLSNIADFQDISNYAKPACIAATNSKIVLCYPDTTFKPKNNITIGECAQIVYSYSKKLKYTDSPSPSSQPTPIKNNNNTQTAPKTMYASLAPYKTANYLSSGKITNTAPFTDFLLTIHNIPDIATYDSLEITANSGYQNVTAHAYPIRGESYSNAKTKNFQLMLNHTNYTSVKNHIFEVTPTQTLTVSFSHNIPSITGNYSIDTRVALMAEFTTPNIFRTKLGASLPTAQIRLTPIDFADGFMATDFSNTSIYTTTQSNNSSIIKENNLNSTTEFLTIDLTLKARLSNTNTKFTVNINNLPPKYKLVTSPIFNIFINTAL